MSVNNDLKNAIGQVKLKFELTQADVAEKLGVKSTYLSDMINGRVPFTDNISDKLYELFNIKANPEERDELVSPTMESLFKMLASQQRTIENLSETVRNLTSKK
jgi:transcriptional regulator with XRE-family HTH domain